MEAHELRHIAEWALDIAAFDPAVHEAEVCVSWCEQQVCPVRYDADTPHDAVQAVQSHTAYGIGILVAIKDGAKYRVGFGSEDQDLSRDGIQVALEIAKQRAAFDPLYIGLPTPVTAAPETLSVHDPEVFALVADDMAHLAAETLDGALSTLQSASYVTGIHVSGEVRSRTEHMIVGNSHGLLASDTSSALLATVQTRLLHEHSHGSGSCAATHVQAFAAYEAGVDAAQQALQTRQSVALDGGTYAAVFSPQAVAALFQELLLPALSLDTVVAGTSPFAMRYGQQIAAPCLTVTDEGRLPGMIGSHRATGEGLPTGTTPLIEQGHLVGFLANTYYTQALASRFGWLLPHNGMRFTTDGRSFATRVGIFPTNLTFNRTAAVSLDTLLAPISDGIYIGGLWHTLPQNGLRTGAFTSTIIGPSFHIQDGKLTRPIRPGTLRIQDNFVDLLQRLRGLSITRQAIPLATRQSIVLAPELYCSQVYVTV